MDGSQLISDETERPTADVDVSQDVIARGSAPPDTEKLIDGSAGARTRPSLMSNSRSPDRSSTWPRHLKPARRILGREKVRLEAGARLDRDLATVGRSAHRPASEMRRSGPGQRPCRRRVVENLAGLHVRRASRRLRPPRRSCPSQAGRGTLIQPLHATPATCRPPARPRHQVSRPDTGISEAGRCIVEGRYEFQPVATGAGWPPRTKGPSP